MIRTFPLFLFLLFSLFCHSQVLNLSGRITADSLEESTVHIINISRGTGTLNSASGSFSIEVEENDTLWFSSVQYEKLEIVVTADILQKKFLEVNLSEVINELEEVKINNYGLSGNLERDVADIKTFDKYKLGIPLSKEPLPTKAERELHSENVKFEHRTLKIPLDMAINALSGRLKRLKLIKANEDLSRLVEGAIAAFSEDFFTSFLNIPKEEIVSFMYYCAENSDLRSRFAKDNELQLIEYLQEMQKQFSEFKNE